MQKLRYNHEQIMNGFLYFNNVYRICVAFYETNDTSYYKFDGTRFFTFTELQEYAIYKSPIRQRDLKKT